MVSYNIWKSLKLPIFVMDQLHIHHRKSRLLLFKRVSAGQNPVTCKYISFPFDIVENMRFAMFPIFAELFI